MEERWQIDLALFKLKLKLCFEMKVNMYEMLREH
jgi:hypothetical protein